MDDLRVYPHLWTPPICQFFLVPHTIFLASPQKDRNVAYRGCSYHLGRHMLLQGTMKAGPTADAEFRKITKGFGPMLRGRHPVQWPGFEAAKWLLFHSEKMGNWWSTSGSGGVPCAPWAIASWPTPVVLIVACREKKHGPCPYHFTSKYGDFPLFGDVELDSGTGSPIFLHQNRSWLTPAKPTMDVAVYPYLSGHTTSYRHL